MVCKANKFKRNGTVYRDVNNLTFLRGGSRLEDSNTMETSLSF